MNIGLNWYLSDNTTSMWGPVGDGAPDPSFLEMTAAKRTIADPVEREAVVKDIAAYICDNAQALHAYTIPALYALSPGLAGTDLQQVVRDFHPDRIGNSEKRVKRSE